MEYFSKKLGFDTLKPLAIELLKETVSILNKYDISYFLISGTLLGYVRHNDFIPWDDDIDLMVDKVSFFAKLPEIIENHNEYLSFFMKDEYIAKICYKTKGLEQKSRWYQNTLIKNRKMMFPFIDLFFYTKSGDEIEFYHKKWQTCEFFPLDKVTFNKIENVCIPKNPHYFLKKNYGKDYMTIAKSSNWNHKEGISTKEIHTMKLSRLKM